MIEVKNLHKSFKGKKVLNGVELQIEKGEIVAIIGKSGCGKSVLIKHIVGLLKPDSGWVKVEDQRIDKISNQELYQLRTKFGFLFQNAALFDSLTVEENIALPLIERNYGYTKKEILKIVNEKLELVGLKGTNKLKPAELSGGMRKRAGLARALVGNPEYIFYDEPTTGLDPAMSDNIDELIKTISYSTNATSIIITHDMQTVKTIPKRTIMLEDGRVYFDGTPEELLLSQDPIISAFIKRSGA